ncbi:MAG: fused MFS/spermidine synthase [Actinomycetota bacterium]|nr:fused MFS/spermidine synthase [Actinomycetota bacterium]
MASVVVFASSGAVLVLETLAGRLVAPYVGVTLETFTAIIGVVLAGISLGTWVGGRAADRYGPERLLGPLLAVGGALVVASLPVVRVLGPGIRNGSTESLVILTVLAFFAPSAVLSAVSPVAVRTQLHDLAVTGTVVGRLSAIGTAGSLAGVFATGFVLVTTMPVPAIVVGSGIALVIGGVAMAIWLRRAERGPLGGAVGLAIVAVGLQVGLPPECDVQTAYYCASVEVDEEREGGRVLRLDTLRHSYVDLDDPTHLEFRYIRWFGSAIDALLPGDEPVDAVHLGGGGFTMPRWLEETRPGSTSVVLELDEQLVELVEDELGLETSDDLQAITGDARVSIAGLDDDSADLAIGDAFGGIAVPWHLTTRELVEEVHRVLRDDGVYIANIIDHPPLRFLRAEMATFDAVFEHVAVIGDAELRDGTGGGNSVLVASDRPLDALDELPIPTGAAELPAGTGALVDDEARAWMGEPEVLTDDFAPVDQWLTQRTG